MDAILRQGAARFNLNLTGAQLAAFDVYARQLIEWNRRVNLTRIVDPTEIATKHFLDSLSVAAALPNLPPGAALVDVGSGAGFPGLPLKIALPHLRLTLLESTGKKCRFLEHVAGVLDLPDVTVLNARAEDAGRSPNHRARYNVAVARAVAALPVLAEYMLPLVKVGGWVVAQKGQNPAAEVKAASNALGVLGGKLVEIRPVDISGLDGERHLIVLQKTKPTPAPYPRRPGLPAKKPI
ncbi:MAG: 16S rRNA (guanine(527)-N(7))-methyltransferase RsmG [Chloroflexi bacterium]|nr:MAG: 16S rRNA (guanine(527)-N(7))-methyltransferase RsmG [Chloroflexota bacterium]